MPKRMKRSLKRRSVCGEIGSAPSTMKRSEERSSPCRSASSIRLAHSSNAKFGPPENVARYLCMVHSQVAGRTRKLIGDIT